MKCPYCGAPMSSENVYCPICGREVRVVNDEEGLEEDLLSSMLKEEVRGQQKDSEKKEPGTDDPKEDDGGNWKEVYHPPGKWKRLICILICIAAIVAGGAVVLHYAGNHSAFYLMNRAKACYREKEYSRSLEYLNQVLKLDGDNVNAMILKARVCMRQDDYDTAESLMKQLIAQQPDNQDGYRLLCRAYAHENEYKKILALSKKTDSDAILKIIDSFLPEKPVISVQGGAYDRPITIGLDPASEEADAAIYYTLNGKEPTKKSRKYSPVKKITIRKEGKYKLAAVTIDRFSHRSRTVREYYNIRFEVPDPPKVSPQGGEFSSEHQIRMKASGGCSIYYAWDGTPSASSTRYSGPIPVPKGNHVLSVISISRYGKVSSVIRFNFIYYPDTAGSNDGSLSAGNEVTSEQTDSGQDE